VEPDNCRPEEPLSQSIVALDATTLDVLDHWQNPTPLENSDFGSSPALFSAQDGTPLIASASKDGWLYVLRRDRLSAGPVWKYQLAVIDAGKPSLGGDPIGGFGSIVSPTFANGLLYAAGGRSCASSPGRRPLTRHRRSDAVSSSGRTPSAMRPR
jgi:hypothetical protein